ncbi:LLM class flavin-dependent oxidoreductase [Gryllotalpicola protaetiae]|uniref:LLM class flavin-dependent oxidoreductase n=1 Tax=Gryllotalpicola protaetiae TaxID=2419771 RepID=A0A387BDZ6_9MICO|nr:LLM class flavin-dependent oxidoreductase [Gryllotalpicola protaetiae]AYG02175.1 LLM class flavin-dependent oxidoreductase [Gryllotalpicola protaetiae]
MTASPFSLAVELDGVGAHPGGSHGLDAHELLSPSRLAAGVRAAERAGFTAATFADSPLSSGIDAIQRASFAAPQTSALGLIPVAHSVYSEPFHVATQLATVDFASYGRAGWIVGVDADPRIAVEYGREAVGPEHATAVATDAVEVARRLWDSWEDDAVIRDATTWRYLDRAKVHYIDFEGASFSVKGPSIIPRPPQGQLPVFADASSGVVGDVALVTSSAEATVAAARESGAALVWLELEVALDHAGLPGAERVDRLDGVTPWAREGFGRYVGDAAGLVDLLTELAGQFDGVRMHPAVLAEDLEELGRAVLPELRRLGVHTPPVVGSTLRESIGLPASVNRYASKASA